MDQVVHALPLAHNVISIAVDQHFRRLRMRIIIRRHGKSIGAGAHDSEQIAAPRPRDLAIFGEEVATLANRPDDVRDHFVGVGLHHRLNGLIRAVKRRTDQIVHAAVDDNEFFGFGFFEILNLREKNPGVAELIDAGQVVAKKPDAVAFDKWLERLAPALIKLKSDLPIFDRALDQLKAAATTSSA